MAGTPKTQKLEDAPEAEKAAREAVQAVEVPEEAETFTVERLTGSEAFVLTGHEPHIVAGALYSTKKKNLTVEEAQAAVKAWLKSPVKED